MVVAAYGLILPQWVAGRAAPGLPEYPRFAAAALARRGADPPRDRGGRRAKPASPSCRWTPASTPARCCWPKRVAIAPDDTTGPLHDKLAALGGRLIVQALELAACGGLTRSSSPRRTSTYAHKIDKAEAAVDWSQPAEVIARRLRAFDPSPGASSVLGGEQIKLWRGEVPSPAAGADGPAGAILAVSPRHRRALRPGWPAADATATCRRQAAGRGGFPARFQCDGRHGFEPAAWCSFKRVANSDCSALAGF